MSADGLARFAYSGRRDGRWAWLAPCALAVSAGVGYGYQACVAANPLVALNIFAPVFCGLALGLLALWLLRAGQVRNASLAWTLTLLVFGSAYAAAVLLALRQEPGIGPGLRFFLWLFELPVLAGFTVGVPIGWWRRAVYDESARRFVRRERVAKLYGPGPFALRSAVTEGGFDALASLELRTLPASEEEGELRFFLHRAETTYLTVHWVGKLPDPRGRKVPRDVLVLRRVRLSGAQLERLLPEAVRSRQTVA